MGAQAPVQVWAPVQRAVPKAERVIFPRPPPPPQKAPLAAVIVSCPPLPRATLPAPPSVLMLCVCPLTSNSAPPGTSNPTVEGSALLVPSLSVEVLRPVAPHATQHVKLLPELLRM